ALIKRFCVGCVRSPTRKRRKDAQCRGQHGESAQASLRIVNHRRSSYAEMSAVLAEFGFRPADFISQAGARLEEKAARLLDVPANSARHRGAMEVPAALDPQFPISGRRPSRTESSWVTPCQAGGRDLFRVAG